MSDCADESFLHPHERSYNSLDNYEEILRNWYYFFGALKTVEALLIATIMISSRVRGVILNKFQWTALINLEVIISLTCIVYYDFFGLGDS